MVHRPHVVIIGAGFGGLRLARRLAGQAVDITVLDRSNHHLFQPLLYQVALAGLSPADIAAPIRALLGRQRNVRVLLAEAERVDPVAKVVHLRAAGDQPQEALGFDYCVIAAGAQTNWFGHDDWAQFAFGMKDLDDALDLRSRVLLALEAAEREPDPARRKALLTFVVIGGGATGVEVAGTLAELSRYLLSRDFRHIQHEQPRVVLVEAGASLLAAFSADLQQAAQRQLFELGAEIRLQTKVQAMTEGSVELASDRGVESIAATTVVWAAGVRPQPLAATLGTPLDRQGRLVVGSDCSLAEQRHVFAIGDIAHFDTPSGPLPGLAPVAMQQADHVAKCLAADLAGRPRTSFGYRDKGIMATIGRSRAVVESGGLKTTGLLAWLMWIFVHILYLADFRNRLMVLLNWAWQWLTFRRGARLITTRPSGQRTPAALRGVLPASGR